MFEGHANPFIANLKSGQISLSPLLISIEIFIFLCVATLILKTIQCSFRKTYGLCTYFQQLKLQNVFSEITKIP